nr:potassium transporter 7-like [Ipomoea batatas]
MSSELSPGIGDGGVLLPKTNIGNEITLGVVFADVGTSPLYSFSVMFSKAPVIGDEDVLGALSLVFHWLSMSLLFFGLTMMEKVSRGGDTFALYSLLCRHANVRLLPNQLPSDTRMSSFRLKVPSPELESEGDLHGFLAHDELKLVYSNELFYLLAAHVARILRSIQEATTSMAF